MLHKFFRELVPDWRIENRTDICRFLFLGELSTDLHKRNRFVALTAINILFYIWVRKLAKSRLSFAAMVSELVYNITPTLEVNLDLRMDMLDCNTVLCRNLENVLRRRR